MKFCNKTWIVSWTLAAVRCSLYIVHCSLFIVLGIALHLSPVTAQNNYLFKTLDARNGLTASQVNCILKDSRGFMWFGTPAGLYRFDGYEFKHFQSDSQDGSSLPDSYIISMQETLDGSLWVETSAGYCIYHPSSDTFERDMRQVFQKMGINSVPQNVYIDRHHNVWGFQPKRGVVCYNMQQQQHYEFGYTHDANSIPEDPICSIGECKEGAVLVFPNGRIICCDVMHQQNIVWSDAQLTQQGLRHSNSLRVFADQMDNIWLYGQGTLFHFDKKTKVWNTSIGSRLGMTGLGADYSVNGISGDRNGNIWIATSRNGLIKVNVNTLEIDTVGLRSMNSTRLQQSGIKSIQSVYVDNTDLLWVGTSKAGVAYWGENIYKFEAKLNGDISAMVQMENGDILYGTSDNGIIGYDGRLASLKVTAMARTDDGSLWVGSKQNGLTRIMPDGSTKIYSQALDSTRNTVIEDHINALCPDKFGNLWIATEGGLQSYNPRLGTFSNYTKEGGKMKVNNITALCYGKEHTIYVGTSEGLTIMNIATSECQHLTGNKTNLSKFTNNYVTQVYEDTRGLIWVGTREGVNVLNPENDQLSYLTEKTGLCNNNVCGIAEDKNNNMWITTSNGVTRVVAQRNHEDGSYEFGLYNYSYDDGLQSNEFNLGSILIKRDSTVIFGGLFGINWVRPKTADETAALPRVMLTQLFIGEEEVLVGHAYDGIVPLTQTLNESNRIELNSDQNTITIKFAAGNYNQSERLMFKYWMEGLDDDWRNGDALKHGVTFTNLKPKTYRLHVKAVSAEGAVSNQERIIEININQPWYFQWWMMLFYVAVIIIVVYLWKIGLNKLRVIWLKKKAILDELMRQREEIKATSDELRQPMARMTSIIMSLSERESMLEEREQLNSLHSQMLQIITRVSDMQTSLEHPMEKARQNVTHNFELDSRGEMQLPDYSKNELTAEIRSQYKESPTSKFVVYFIDDNPQFIQFISTRLRFVYDFHAYEDIVKAASDIEVKLPDLVICKQDMHPMTGSELCNHIKSDKQLNRIKFVLMTETKINSKDLQNMDITMAADEYLAKPFNVQEAAMRFNQLLGIGAIDVTNNLIEGAETRLLEDRNSSMTTATETMDYGSYDPTKDQDETDDEIKALEVKYVKNLKRNGEADMMSNDMDEWNEYSMTDMMDRKLIMNIEQYVQQNMSRGQLSLEDLAQAMGMGMRPFFQKVRDITGKTPAEVVRDMRLKHACLLLKRTNINLSELATNVGFTTGEHLINAFKEKFGISPTEYRQKYRR